MKSGKITKKCVITNNLGLHARAAAKFVQISSRFDSEVSVIRGGNEVDGKSILDILSLGCLKGARIEIKAAGKDAIEAASALEELINEKFGEE
ncbi:MAG: HPr family phosphocarrier protein [Pseudomonadota bacterium]